MYGETPVMVSSIDNISSPSQSASHYEKDDPVHRETSPWAATGAEALGQRQFRLLAIAGQWNDG